MGDTTLSRRQFFEKMSASGTKTRVEHFPLATAAEQENSADLSAYQQETITLGGGLNPYNGPWTTAQAAHLLRRTTFGVKKAQLDLLLTMSLEEAMDMLLTLEPATTPPVNNYNNTLYTDPAVPSGATWVDTPYNIDAEGYRIESWRGWWLDRMINTGPNITEKMTLFWHNHFATKTESLFWGTPIYKHNQLLRNNALANFKTLTKQVTLDPLMLFFLNGRLNNFFAPDENYARELQELFTVGKDSQVTYSEDDVVAAARVLTGWTVDANGNTIFVPALHDAGFKVFSSFYNQTIIQGSSNGDAELDALLDMIFQKEEVSLYVCRKLYRFFVYYKIDADVEQNVIVPLAQIFRDNNYDILPVVRTLLMSEHFFDAANKGCQIKTPLDMVAGLLRNFNLDVPSPSLYDDYNIRTSINYFCGGLLMLPGSPPNVAGWPAYRQSPNYYRNWITTDTIRNRNILTDVMSFVGVDVGPEKMIIDHIAFVSQFDHPEDPNALIDDMLTILYPMPISLVKKLTLKSILLSGQLSDYYWTNAWNAYVSNPNDQMAYQTVLFRLASLHKYIMNLAEYQLI